MSFFLPLSVKPLDDPNHDPGESIIVDGETAHISVVSNREFALEAVAAINSRADMLAALEAIAVNDEMMDRACGAYAPNGRQLSHTIRAAIALATEAKL